MSVNNRWGYQDSKRVALTVGSLNPCPVFLLRDFNALARKDLALHWGLHLCKNSDAWQRATGRPWVPPSTRTWEQQPELAPHALRDALQHQLPSFFCAVHADPLPILGKVNLPGLLFQKLLGLKGIMMHDDIPKDFEDGERSHGKCAHCPLWMEQSSGQNSWEGKTRTFWPPSLIGSIYHVLRSCHDAFWPQVRIPLP